MNDPRLPLPPSHWMTGVQYKPLKTTFEIEGKTHTECMEAVITMKSEDCKDKTLFITRNRYPDDVTKKGSFTSHYFSVKTESSQLPSTPLACIRKYDNTDISLMKKFILYFDKNNFKDVFEEHEHCNLTRGRTLTKQDRCFNRPIDRNLYKAEGEYRTAEGHTVASYHKRDKGTTNKYVSGSVTTLPAVYASYYENGAIGEIGASLDDINVKAHYDREGNIRAVDLGGNRVSLDVDKFMYNISTTMVKYYSGDLISNHFTYNNSKRSINSDICTKGIIGFIKEDRIDSCNPFASKDEEFIVNKIYEVAMNEHIPEEIKKHVFNKSSFFSVKKITTMNNCCKYYQIEYDSPDDEVKYNSFYNRYAMPIYISYSYTQADGKHIEVKNCYDTFVPICAKEIVCESMTETSPDKSNVKITNRFNNTTITKEISYLDPDDRGKTTFKVNMETTINEYHDIAKFLGDVIEGTIDFNDYLDAVDVYINTENMSKITVPVPESIYTFFNSLIETTMGHSTFVIPATSLPYGKLNFTYFGMSDIIDNLMNPCKIDSWVRQSGSYFCEDERLRRYLQIFNYIDFNSFILPEDEAKALVERVDKLFPDDDEDGEGDDF